MLTDYTYICPHCQNALDSEQRIHLRIENGNGEIASIYLHPKPGVYQYECIPKLELQPTEMVTFYCPCCNEDLTSDEYFNFSELTMKVNDQISFQVLFSRIHGEEKTYVVTEDFDHVSLKNF